MRTKKHFLLIATLFIAVFSSAQHIIPVPFKTEALASEFVFQKKVRIISDARDQETARYLSERLKKYTEVVQSELPAGGDIILNTSETVSELGSEGYQLEITNGQIKITANSNQGLFYGIQSLLQLLPAEVQAGEPFTLNGYTIQGVKITDMPKYAWRSFMLDSGRQYQRPEFIKRYLDLMAMLKMNVFHWHLTEGQGWRIEIKKYPKLTEIGSNVATGKEQQGYYTQDEIRDIVAYAAKLYIDVVPEIDVPGHAEAALTAYPEMSCFNEIPESVMQYSAHLFCGGKESTYHFLEDILDEICDLFPSSYIHLGGDEAPKDNWDKCPHCQNKIKQEGLLDSDQLQSYFSSRLATYLQQKGKKAIFWGDVVYADGYPLPENVVIQWWNWKKHGDTALINAIKRGHQVIVNTNYYSYFNYPVVSWSKYGVERTFDMRDAYEKNPGDLTSPHPLVMGMCCSLWTDWYVQEHMVDKRVFPRIYTLAEQMWNKGNRLPFDEFNKLVKSKYYFLHLLGVDYGPALREEVPADYNWD
ncbi:MAG: beta-N-acetylhexosaminidase [Paludibacter sp.]|nr:beta-N-acetylhexosaminidase [Paludibacter sp.]MDD4198742.1 beta-N-acetylhexosaminidase [Paludibacter sp.]MDD4427739.1 beta-N-acetylhexosaminidase [Paludibacter sp.]